MTVARRTLLGALALLPAGLPFSARAEDAWPSRLVRLISPYGPGGSNDISLRLLAEEFGRSLHQQFIVENKPGAGSADCRAVDPGRAGAKEIRSRRLRQRDQGRPDRAAERTGLGLCRDRQDPGRLHQYDQQPGRCERPQDAGGPRAPRRPLRGLLGMREMHHRLGDRLHLFIPPTYAASLSRVW